MLSTTVVFTLGAFASYTVAATCPPALAVDPTSVPIALFCQSYLGIKPLTLTQFTTPVVTRTMTLPIVASAISIVKLNVSTLTETTVTSTASFTPAASTTVATITSTAYLDNSGNTIFFGKRDALPTALAKRAITSTNNNTVPFQLQGFSRSDLLTLCNCNGFTKPLSTIIRTMAARPSVVLNTKTLLRTVFTRTTVTNLLVSTKVNVQTAVVTAAAPVIIKNAVSFIPSIDSCPPTYAAAFLCPEGTGQAIPASDPSYDPNYLSCGVVNQFDGYSGFCLYWNDDGQPAGSTLSLGTTGDSTQDLTRAAVYGNASSDDCPSWSDYTCSLSGSTLTAIHRRASAATHVKVKMPKHIPGTRGSKYVHTGKY